MNYTTQMDAARKGIITRELETVAEKEQFQIRELQKLVAEGKVVIPANRLHTSLDPNGIGSMLKTKINVNLGTSRDCRDLDMELVKVNDAVKMGAESIMDLSSFGDRCGSGIRSYHCRHRRSHCGGVRGFLSVLCDAGRKSAPAGCG